MPPVIAAAVAYAVPATAATAFTVGATAVTYASLISYAAVIGGSVAYSSSQSAKLRRSLGTASIDQGRTVMVRDPLAARRLIYGQALVSGTIVFVHTTGAKNEYLHLVVVLAGHQVEEIGDIYFNDELVTFSGSTGGAATGKFAGYARVNFKLGGSGQTADADLVAETGGVWTSAHRCRDCALLAVRLKWSADLFPNGMPTIKAMVKGKKVYDPRTATTVWSSNAALCATDFLMDATWGKGVALARIRSADLIEAANICDEDVVLADTTTEKRYAINGTVLSSQDPSAVLFDLAGAMAGHIVDTGGTWTIRAGAYRSPAVTLTDDDLVGGFSMQPRQSRQDTFNRVRGVYISPDNQWAAGDFPAVSNSTYKAKDGGIWLDRDVQYNFTTSSATAQRLAKIELERGRQQITVSAPYSLKAMQLMPGDAVALTRERLGWSAKEFEVVDWSFRQTGEGENIGLAIDLALRETASGVWDWADGEETTVDLAPNTTLPDPFTVGTPTMTLLTDSTTATIQPDGTVQPRLKVSWLTPNNIHIESGGFVEIEFKKTTDSDYTVWAAVRGDALFDYILDVKVGVQYDVRVRFRSNAGVRGAYASGTSAAVVGDTTTPNAPTSFSATARAGFIDLNWTPSTSGTVNEYKIYRSIVSAFAGFALLAQTANSQYQDSTVSAGTQYWYYVVAESVVGNGSPATSVVTATAIFSPSGAVPSSPTAPAQPGSPVVGTYDATDASVFAYVTLKIAAMPSGAVWQNLLYRRTGASEWMVGAQFKNTGTVTMRLDDLSPGIGYDIATQAWNGAGGSAVVTGTSFTAAGKTTAPTAPSSVTVTSPASGGTPVPKFTTYLGGKFQQFVGDVRWVAGSEKDLDRFEIKVTATNDDAATDDVYSVDSQTGVVSIPAGRRSATVHGSILTAGYLRIRAVNVSGVASGWTNFGNINSTSYIGVPLGSAVTRDVGTASGTVAAGDDSRITGAAQKASNLSDLVDIPTTRTNLGLGNAATKNTGTTAGTVSAGDDSRITGAAQKASNLSDLASASTSRSNLGFRAAVSHVETVPGGSPTYVFSYTHNFGVLQDKVLVQVVAVAAGALDMTEYLVQHDYGNGGNTANVAYFVISTKSGVNLTTQSVRMTINWLP